MAAAAAAAAVFLSLMSGAMGEGALGAGGKETGGNGSPFPVSDCITRLGKTRLGKLEKEALGAFGKETDGNGCPRKRIFLSKHKGGSGYPPLVLCPKFGPAGHHFWHSIAIIL